MLQPRRQSPTSCGLSRRWPYGGNLAKFGQHPDLRAYLLATGDRVLVFAPLAFFAPLRSSVDDVLLNTAGSG